MRRSIVLPAAAVCLLFTAVTAPLSAQSAATADILKRLAGTWRAAELRTGLTTDFDVSVWGPNASRLRNVELTIKPDGSGLLRVSTSVVDGQGKTRPFSSSVVEAQLSIRAPQQSSPGRVQPDVTVKQAEERFLDDKADKFAIDGLKVTLTFDPSTNRLDMRYDTRDGTGSFPETLTRGGGGQKPTRGN